jgi:hypothetical protein
MFSFNLVPHTDPVYNRLDENHQIIKHNPMFLSPWGL